MAVDETALATQTQPVTHHPWRGIIIYLAIAFGLSWVAQIVVALTARMTVFGGATLIAAAALMWPPALGAFVVRRWIEHSFADAGLRWPAWRYLLLAWFGPFLLTLAALLISSPIYPLDLTFAAVREMAEQAGQPLPASPAAIVAIQLITGLTIAVPLNSIFAFGEEFGWRGYLLPALVDRLGAWPGLLARAADPADRL